LRATTPIGFSAGRVATRTITLALKTYCTTRYFFYIAVKYTCNVLSMAKIWGRIYDRFIKKGPNFSRV
jgi:hypothetical protein